MSIALGRLVFSSWSRNEADDGARRAQARRASQEPNVAADISDIADSVLLDQLRTGSDAIAAEAFSTLFLRHTPTMFVAARRGACNEDVALADDAVQTVMIRIWERRAELPRIDDVQGYLVRAVANECHNRRRARARAEARDAHGGEMDIAEGHTPETLVMEHELHAALQHAIQALPGRMGDLFRAWYSSGASHESIAARFGVTPQAVARARLRAIAHLRSDPMLAPFWSASKD